MINHCQNLYKKEKFEVPSRTFLVSKIRTNLIINSITWISFLEYRPPQNKDHRGPLNSDAEMYSPLETQNFFSQDMENFHISLYLYHLILTTFRAN